MTLLCIAWFLAQHPADLDRSLAIVDAPEIYGYVSRLAKNLSDNFQFAVFDEVTTGDLPPVAALPYNQRKAPSMEPLAAASGLIYVPLTLLKKVENEPELAAVMAHSIAHEMLGHPAQIGRSAADAPSGNNTVSVPVSLLKFARQCEIDADTAAVGILSNAGYNPHALQSYVKRLPHAPTSRMTAAFSAMPRTADRLKAIELAIQALPDKSYSSDTGGFQNMKVALNKVKK